MSLSRFREIMQVRRPFGVVAVAKVFTKIRRHGQPNEVS